MGLASILFVNIDPILTEWILMNKTGAAPSNF